MYKAWQAIGGFMEKQDGFIGSTLYRNCREPNTLINKGSYESVESFMACVKSPEFKRLSEVLTRLKVKRDAGLYDEFQQFGAGGN